MAEFPSNSQMPKTQPSKPSPADKHVKPIAKGQRKKKSLGKQFTETFVGGDLKTTAHYVIFDVAIPGLRDMIADSAVQGIERLIFGEARTHRRPMGPIRPPGPQPGKIQYQNIATQMSQQPSALPQRQRSRPAPQVTDFDDVVLSSRRMAQEVLERMGDMISHYGSVSVADFYTLVDMQPNHTDQNWGWTDIKGSSVSGNRGGGYLITLPDPEPF